MRRDPTAGSPSAGKEADGLRCDRRGRGREATCRSNVLTAAFPASERAAYLPIIIEVSGRDLLVGQEGAQLPVEFYTYASDQHGEMKDFFTQMVTLDLTKGRETFVDTRAQVLRSPRPAAGEVPAANPGAQCQHRSIRRRRRWPSTFHSTMTPNRPAAAFLPRATARTGSWCGRTSDDDSSSRSCIRSPSTASPTFPLPASLTEREEAAVCLVAYNIGEGDIQLDGIIVAEDGRDYRF